MVILAIALQEIGGGAASPILATIMAAYPDVNPTTIMLIQTMPSITTMIFAPICGKLADFIPKRVLSLFAIGLFVIAGVAPAFMTSLPVIYVLRGVLGIAIGMILTLVMGLIADFYEGGERAQMYGWVQTIGSLGGMFFQLAGGFLGAINWHYAFYAYLITLAVLVFAFFALPEPPKKIATSAEEKAKVAAAANASGDTRKLWSGNVIMAYLGFFMLQLLVLVLVTNTSVLIANEGLGDASNAGIALTFMTFGGMIASALYGNIYKGLKKMAVPPLILVMGVGYLIVFFASSLTMVYAGAFVTGLGIASSLSGYFQKVSLLVPPAAATLSMSIMICVQGLGNFAEPFVFDILLKALGMEIGRQAFGLGAGLLIATAVVSFIWSMSRPDPAIMAAAFSPQNQGSSLNLDK
jgi:MFS family permease